MLGCNNDFTSSPFAIRDFMQTTVWRDMLQELTNWEYRVMEELAEPSFDTNTGAMVLNAQERMLYDEMQRGSLKAIRQVKQLPQILLEILEQQITETKENQNATEGSDDFELDDE